MLAVVNFSQSGACSPKHLVATAAAQFSKSGPCHEDNVIVILIGWVAPQLYDAGARVEIA
jgi:hypothetical protein